MLYKVGKVTAVITSILAAWLVIRRVYSDEDSRGLSAMVDKAFGLTK